MRTKRTGQATSTVWDRAIRRRETADWLDSACTESERGLKGIARCAGVTDTKLRAMRRGDHVADVATVLGLPEHVRDDFFARVAGSVQRAWVPAIDPETGDLPSMIEELRDAFEDAHRELRRIAKDRQFTPDRARALVKPLRAVERIVTGLRVLAERRAGEEEE
jgi:hypothetical protein